MKESHEWMRVSEAGGREEREIQLMGSELLQYLISFLRVGGYWQLISPLKGMRQVVNPSIGPTRLSPEGRGGWKLCSSSADHTRHPAPGHTS